MSKNHSSIGTYVPVSAVFPGESGDIRTLRALLASLSRTDTMFWCARLNRFFSDPDIDHDDATRNAVARFFAPEDIERLNVFYKEHADSGKVAVFFRAQLLELLRWACLLAEDDSDDGNTFDNPLVRRRFAKAALVASDVWATRVYRSLLTVPEDSLPSRQDGTCQRFRDRGCVDSMKEALLAEGARRRAG